MKTTATFEKAIEISDGGTGGVMVKTFAPNQEWQGSSPTSIMAFFFFPLLTPMPWNSLSSTPSNEEMSLTTSFGGDVKPSVLGDLAQLTSSYSRP